MTTESNNLVSESNLRTVTFVHTSMMTAPAVEFVTPSSDGKWKTFNTSSEYAAFRVDTDELDTIVYWS